MKGLLFYTFVAFFLFEMTLPLYLDLVTDLNIELNEAEKESEKEKELEEDHKKRRTYDLLQGIISLYSVDFVKQCKIDPFRISENEVFELNSPPPEQ